MSVNSEINRINTAKTDIKGAIEEAGVSVPSTASISDYDDYVRAIPSAVLTSADGRYKQIQTAVSSPTAASTTSTTFIDSISQNAQGVITATKKTLPAYPTTLPANGGTADKIGTSTVGSSSVPVYIKSGTPTVVSSLSESYLSWGGKSITGGITPIDAACSLLLSANRLAFGYPDGITIEYSTNGTSWTTYGCSNSDKTALISGIGAGFAIGSRVSGNTVNDKLRITLNATNMGVYTALRKILLNINTNYSTGCNVIIEKAMKGSETTFSTVGKYDLAGWPGWNSIPIEASFGGDATQTSNIAVLRLTFGITGVNSDTSKRSALQVLDIVAIGVTYWNTPSTLAKTGHLYNYNALGDATFPAKVTATTFVGALSGNAASATSAGNAEKLNGLTSFYYSSVNVYPEQGNYNWSIQSGFYRSNGKEEGLPNTNSGCSIIHCNFDSNAANQIFLDRTKDYLAYRRKTAGTWYDWKQIAFIDSNVASATKAAQDSDGNAINSTYLKIANLGSYIKTAEGTNINSVGTPSVTASTSNGVTTFTFNYLKGATGAQGASVTSATQTTSSTASSGKNTVTFKNSAGTTIGSVDIYNGAKGADGTNGKDGTNGVSCTHSWSGTTLSVTSASGTSSANLKGATGDAAGFGTPTASVDANVGTPSVTITSSGANTAKVFNFAFKNLKGATGNSVKDLVCVTASGGTTTGSASTADSGTSYYRIKDSAGNWLSGTIAVKNGSKGSSGTNGTSCTHSWNGTTLSITSASGTSSANLKGAKGDNGTSVTISSINQSTAAGGTSTVTFSDGNTLSIKNGSNGSNATTTAVATQAANGLMSAADKIKLDGISTGADAVTFTRNLTSGTKIGTLTINGTGTDLFCETNTNTWRPLSFGGTSYSGTGVNFSGSNGVTLSVGTADSGGQSTVTIASNETLYPKTTATYDIGSSDYRYKTGYFSNTLIIGGAGMTGSTSGVTGCTFGSAGNMELVGSTSTSGPKIDFHYNKSTSDFTTRIIEDNLGQLSIKGNLYVYPVSSSSGTTTTINSSAKFYVNNNGAYWTSDKRHKDNIQNPVKSGLLQDSTGFIRKFDWKSTGKTSYGYIAQDLLQQIPEAVDYDEKDNKYSVDYTVAHSFAIGQLVIKIKELEEEIKSLKAQIK